MLVSVILPTYNRASLIRRAVDSVLSQRGAEIELIVVDDGSTDETGAALAAAGDPRLTVVRLPARRGAGAARNAGVAVARGEWLAFQDSDDEWTDEHLAVLLAARDDDAGVGVVYSDMWIEHGRNRRYFAAPRLDPRRPPTLERALAFGVARIGIQASLVSRSAFDRAGGFDEALPAFEDFELFARLTTCCRFRHVARPTVVYRPTEDGLSHDHRRVAAALEAILRKHAATIRSRSAGVAAYLLQIGRRRAGYGDWPLFRDELGRAFRTAPLSVAGGRAAFYLADDWVRRRLLPASVRVLRRAWPRSRQGA